MNARMMLLVVLAAGHLALVICGAAHIPLLPGNNVPGKVLDWYGALSGADSGYGFFAPEVGSQTQAVLILTDDAGRTWTETLEESDNQEVRLRLGSMLSTVEEAPLRRGLLATWAARAFGRHPEAREVIVRIEVFDVPTLAETRDGATPEWQVEFERSFRRDP
jgi:hypothetical protein